MAKKDVTDELSEQIVFRLPKSLLERVEEVARRSGRSRSSFMRYWLEAIVTKHLPIRDEMMDKMDREFVRDTVNADHHKYAGSIFVEDASEEHIWW